MKETGIKGIGQVPDCWRLQQLGVFFSEVKEKNDSFLCDMPLQFKMGEIIRKPERQSEISEDEQRILEAYTIVKPDDIVINGLNLNFDFNSLRIAKVKDNGIITSAYIIIRPRKEGISSYFNYLLKALDSQKIFHGMGEGLRLTLKYKEVKSMILPTPSFEEQQRIANFLDQKCAEVDDLIALQESMITELQAYKQSVITETVTRGLDPNAPLIDSGVEWIGQIPQHWEVDILKRVVSSISKGTGITKEEVFEDGDTPCVRYGEIYSKYDRSFSACLSYTKKSVLPVVRYFHHGDLLCAGTGELVEEIGRSVVYVGNEECLAGGDIIILSPKVNSVFLNYALNSNYAQSQKSCGKAKLKVVHISASDLGGIQLALPPLAEQQAIADFLDERCADIDTLIQTKREKIESLKEYRKSIIYEYVTGKKQV